MADWDVKAYHVFEKERKQPSIDLLRRIEDIHAERIIDIGCGSGMSTGELIRKWPCAKVIGIDLSATMLEKAKASYPQVDWQLRDGNNSLADMGKFDVVFSNASLQWLDDHEERLMDWYHCLHRGGAVAVQVPLFSQMPAFQALMQSISQERWQPYFKHINEAIFHNEEASQYYDLASRTGAEIQMWETDYFHVMESHEAISTFLRSTGFRPYLNVLNDMALQEAFVNTVTEYLKNLYPVQENGKVIFKFKRLFIVMRKPE